MEELNVLNIPAYKRKRNINARAKKKPSYMTTSKAKKPAKRTRTRSRVTTVEDKIREVAIAQKLPSQDLFPSPIQEEISQSALSQNEFREMKLCGMCDGYFDKINVAVIQVTSAIRTGNTILIETNEGLFEQTIDSMQINRKDVSLARAGSDIGIKTLKEPKVGGNVYKVI